MSTREMTGETRRIRRRYFLRVLGVASAGAIAGCAGDEAGPGTDDEEADGSPDEEGGDGEDAPDDSDGNDEDAEGDDVEFVTYTNDEMGYEIDHPDDWVVEDSLLESVDIRLPGSDQQIRIAVFDYGEELSLDVITEEAIENTEQWMDDVAVLGETDLQLESGEGGRVIELQYTNPRDLIDVRLHSKLLLVPVETVVYQVEAGTGEDEYDDAFDALVETVLASLTITEIPEPEETTPGVDDLTTYANDQFGYAVEYPEAWTVWEQTPDEVYITDGAGTSELGLFVFDASTIDSLDQLADEMLAIIERDYTDVELLDERDTVLASGQDARFVDLTYDDPRDALGPRRSHLLVSIDSDIAYLVEMVALEETFDDAFAELAVEVFDSFEVDTGGVQARTVVRPLSTTSVLTSALHHDLPSKRVGVSRLPGDHL